MNRPFKLEGGGLCFFRGAPRYGFQDVGLSPGGPVDRLAALTGNIMLEQDDYSETLEIIIPPVVVSTKPFLFVLTGAPRSCVLNIKGRDYPVDHGEVALAPAGSAIRFSHSRRGFRTIMSYRTAPDTELTGRLEGRRRGEFSRLFTYFDVDEKVRILPGPEWNILGDPLLFTSIPWRISPDSSSMGIRLEGPSVQRENRESMISDAVADGTVQLTPRGPIVLHRHRQTVGGYPRICNVISADLDRLAQIAPGEHFRFKLISFDETCRINQRKDREIGLFRHRFK